MHTAPAGARLLPARHKTQGFSKYVNRFVQLFVFAKQPLDCLLRRFARLHALHFAFLQPFFPPPVIDVLGDKPSCSHSDFFC